MKQRRLGGNVGGSLVRHQPFATLDDVLNRESFARLAFVKKRNGAEVRKIQRAAKRDEE